METKCDADYDFKTLTSILEPKIYNNILSTLQQEEIRKADIENLEMCKYCNYAGRSPLTCCCCCLKLTCCLLFKLLLIIQTRKYLHV
jgi:hypothetical protein